MSVSPYGHVIVINTSERVLLKTQLAGITIVDTLARRHQNTMLSCHGANTAADHITYRNRGISRQVTNLLESQLGVEPNAFCTHVDQRLQGVIVVDRNALAHLWSGPALNSQRQLRDISHGNRLTCGNVGIQAIVVNLAAHLVKPRRHLGEKILWPRGLCERIACCVQTICSCLERNACLLGSLNQNTYLCLRRICFCSSLIKGKKLLFVLSFSLLLIGKTGKRSNLLLAVLVLLKKRSLELLTCRSADLVDSTKTHAARIVHLDVKAYGLKRRGSHAANVLNKLVRGYRLGACLLHHKALGRRACHTVCGSKGHSKGLANAGNNSHVNSSFTRIFQ